MVCYHFAIKSPFEIAVPRINTGFLTTSKLFPLDGADGLGGQVHQDAVDALDLVGDPVGDLVQNLVGDLLDGGGHGIGGVDGADDGGPALVAALVLDTDGLDVGHGDEVLPDLLGQAALVELVTQDGIGLTQSLQTVAGDGTQAADTQAGAGEGLTVDHGMGQAQSLADYTDLVLEQQLDGLHQLKLQILGQTTHIVVGLDSLLALSGLLGLQNVGVDGALCQEGHIVQLTSLVSKDGDELLADDLALAFGVGDTGQQAQEMIGGIDVNQVGIQAVPEHLDDTLGLVLTHEAVVDVDADELLADGLDQQSGNDGRIDTAGQGQQHLLVADLLADSLDLLVDEGIGQLKIGDAGHGFGSDIGIHNGFLLLVKVQFMGEELLD